MLICVWCILNQHACIHMIVSLMHYRLVVRWFNANWQLVVTLMMHTHHCLKMIVLCSYYDMFNKYFTNFSILPRHLQQSTINHNWIIRCIFDCWEIEMISEAYLACVMFIFFLNGAILIFKLQMWYTRSQTHTSMW